MSRRGDPQTTAKALVCCRGLMKIFDDQTEEGRASLLGFFHFTEEARSVTMRFRVLRSGRARLVMEANPEIPD